MITTNATINLERKISDTLFLLSVKIERYKEWIPGMFMQISLEPKTASEPWLESRAFSFANWGNEKAFILVRREGNFTRNLVEKAMKGFKTSVRYPFGYFLLNSNHDKVFLSGGTGVSVFLSYLDYINSKNRENERVLFFHSTKSVDETLRKFYWNTIPSNICLQEFITDGGSNKYTGRMKFECLQSHIKNFSAYDYYICGPPQFSLYWSEKLKSLGIISNLEQWVNKG
jgi:NAD(P)H-flavin reductase